MGFLGGDCSPKPLEGGIQGIGEALAVVVVDIGDGDALDAVLLQDFRQDLALLGVRRRRTENQVLVLERGQRRRRRSR
jgi:hypothetical protein